MVEKSITSRAAAFQRNEELESLLDRLSTLLAPAQERILDELGTDRQTPPLVFVMGPLRSGTTLFMQWLAATGAFAYPTNMLSRFYAAPGIGALIQMLLTDGRYNFRNEILDFSHPVGFESTNGKTTGALAPNEFWYFWRRFIPDSEYDWLPDEELLEQVDTERMARELQSLAAIFEKPFALKGMILNYNISFLNRVFKDALFVQLVRDPVDNVASVLDARYRQYGDDATWYSFRIPEYPKLISLSALDQCAGQLSYINRAISFGMSSIPDHRKVIVHYETFCRDPAGTYAELLRKLDMNIEEFPYKGPAAFRVSRVLDEKRRIQISRALAAFDT